MCGIGVRFRDMNLSHSVVWLPGIQPLTHGRLEYITRETAHQRTFHCLGGKPGQEHREGRIQPYRNTLPVHPGHVVVMACRSSPGSHHGTRTGAGGAYGCDKPLQSLSFKYAEEFFAIVTENGRYGFPLFVLQHLVQISKGNREHLGEPATEMGLTGSHETGEKDDGALKAGTGLHPVT